MRDRSEEREYAGLNDARRARQDELIFEFAREESNLEQARLLARGALAPQARERLEYPLSGQGGSRRPANARRFVARIPCFVNCALWHHQRLSCADDSLLASNLEGQASLEDT